MPLGAVPGIRWVSIQKNPHGGRLPFPHLDLGPALSDFADLARVMGQLALLITVDTAPAHLMGTLGRPVWILLPDPPDWRWLLERTDSPWYPSARLFRQETRGNWSDVVAGVATALGQFRDQKGAHERPSD